MRRIFDDYAYGTGPRTGCWWDKTCEIAPRQALKASGTTDVAIIGAGFTGLSAARTLAAGGATVKVLEMHRIGWGASGRNGGFCCLGGAKAEDAELDRGFGKAARLEYRAAEKDAVTYVDKLLSDNAVDVDRHSRGETALAHRPQDMDDFQNSIASYAENYGVTPDICEPDQLSAQGFGGGPFYGALTIPIGFGLNPRKYINGLAQLAENTGAEIFDNTAVKRLEKRARGWRLICGEHRLDAGQVLLATNGYSSEDIPEWLAGRYMPSQSTVLVTRPLSQAELNAQGWTSNQMSYDTRNLLHYFRLMPDRRFLFGMRGGLLTGVTAEERARKRTRRDFEQMFPAWKDVESQHTWSGFVSLARRKVPFAGPIPGESGLWASLCYHGNGVAMGTYAGHVIATQILNNTTDVVPKVMQTPLHKFPFGRMRRVLMPPLYANLMLKDR